MSIGYAENLNNLLSAWQWIWQQMRFENWIATIEFHAENRQLKCARACVCTARIQIPADISVWILYANNCINERATTESNERANERFKRATRGKSALRFTSTRINVQWFCKYHLNYVVYMVHGVWYHRGCWHPREYSIFGTFAHMCVQNLAAVAAACVFIFCSSMRCCFFFM